MTKDQIREIVLDELKKNDGKLSMRPCWVARDFMPPGKRLGLTEENLFSLDIAEGCVMNKLLQPETISYDKEGVPHHRISCCLVKNRI